MEQTNLSDCYACGHHIGLFRSVFRPVVETFESAFDGKMRAAFCSTECKKDAILSAAAVRKSFPPQAPRPPRGGFAVTER